ncbi:MAG: peptidoglycan-binding protein LysM [Rhodocyclaceae bacterium]|nr:peptidoglycan-binding protein LysM [Rhodocyclaceae bacterium]
MGLFSFIKDAGEKLFGIKTAQAAQAAEDAGAQAGKAIEAYIAQQNLGLSNLGVAFADGRVTLTGNAPSQEAAEKAVLAAGNVEGVTEVDNQIQFPAGTETRYHDVVKGDTLSAIAKQYYGDASKYPVIFEANKPMLSHPDKIYPGQKLRIPAL